MQRLNKLKNEIQKCKTKIVEIRKESFIQKLGITNTPKNEQSAINEILLAAQKSNSKTRRYSDEWILLSMLLHMRSPKTYNFLRETAILPLPSTQTVRRYISLVIVSM